MTNVHAFSASEANNVGFEAGRYIDSGHFTTTIGFEKEEETLEDIAKEIDTVIDRLFWVGLVYKASVVVLLSLILWRVW